MFQFFVPEPSRILKSKHSLYTSISGKEYVVNGNTLPNEKKKMTSKNETHFDV